MNAEQIDTLPLYSIIEVRTKTAISGLPAYRVYIRKQDGWRGTHGGIASGGASFRGEDVYLIREGKPTNER